MKGMYKPKNTNVVKLKKYLTKKDKDGKRGLSRIVGGVVQFRMAGEVFIMILHTQVQYLVY